MLDRPALDAINILEHASHRVLVEGNYDWHNKELLRADVCLWHAIGYLTKGDRHVQRMFRANTWASDGR